MDGQSQKMKTFILANTWKGHEYDGKRTCILEYEED